MKKFNDSTLVSSCLNFAESVPRQSRDDDAVWKKEIYLSQYKRDFKEPNVSSFQRLSQPTLNGCRCLTCLGS